MRKLTKANIEQLAKDIYAYTKEYDLGVEYLLFYNGKVFDPDGEEIRQGNPKDWNIDFPDNFIFGMVYDGDMREIMNMVWVLREGVDEIFEKYGLYLEDISPEATTAYPLDEMEIEYTKLPTKEIEPAKQEYILYGPGRCEERWLYTKADYPRELDTVMVAWKAFSERYGRHDGSCIIGEGIHFDYKGNSYKMCNQGVYQGSIHFEELATKAEQWLAKLGATNMWIDYGRLD